MKALALGYHDVSELGGALVPILPGHSTRYTLRRRDFVKHLDAVRRCAGTGPVRTVDRFDNWESPAPVFLTFDDGAASGYTCVADELEQRNWRGHFFVTTDWIGRAGFLDRRQIQELYRRGHVIGSHSCSHPPRMSALEWGDLVREWSQSTAILSDILGTKIVVASVPDGYYSDKVGRAASAAGIQVLFTSEPRTAVRLRGGCLIVGRYFIQTHTPPEHSAAIASGAIAVRWRQSLLWEGKRLAKAIAGPLYPAVRHLILCRESSRTPQPALARGEGDQ